MGLSVLQILANIFGFKSGYQSSDLDEQQISSNLHKYCLITSMLIDGNREVSISELNSSMYGHNVLYKMIACKKKNWPNRKRATILQTNQTKVCTIWIRVKQHRSQRVCSEDCRVHKVSASIREDNPRALAKLYNNFLIATACICSLFIVW